ncbi:5124_t:CDS:2, partial [Cetraspora pellucida]
MITKEAQQTNMDLDSEATLSQVETNLYNAICDAGTLLQKAIQKNSKKKVLIAQEALRSRVFVLRVAEEEDWSVIAKILKLTSSESNEFKILLIEVQKQAKPHKGQIGQPYSISNNEIERKRASGRRRYTEACGKGVPANRGNIQTTFNKQNGFLYQYEVTEIQHSKSTLLYEKLQAKSNSDDFYLDFSQIVASTSETELESNSTSKTKDYICPEPIRICKILEKPRVIGNNLWFERKKNFRKSLSISKVLRAIKRKATKNKTPDWPYSIVKCFAEYAGLERKFTGHLLRICEATVTMITR